MDENLQPNNITELLERTIYLAQYLNSKKELKEERKIVEKMYRDFMKEKYDKYIEED